jgi:hypothetical protein
LKQIEDNNNGLLSLTQLQIYPLQHALTTYAILSPYNTKELRMAACIEQMLEKAECNSKNDECRECVLAEQWKNVHGR